MRGAAANDYTAGVICSKGCALRRARPSPRPADSAAPPHHPRHIRADRVGRSPWTRWPLPSSGATERYGSETVWPYYYAGTMGLVQRDGINRLRHTMRYSGQHSTICTTLAWNGFIAGTGRLAGADPREMAKSDLVIIWGTNAASTQVNVMTHALRARRERGAKIVCIDVYRQTTAKQADLLVCLRPGTDGALACALMHVLFRDGCADREYLARYTDRPGELEAHLAGRTPEWAAAITGVPADTIETLAKMIGTTPRTFFRLGYGFSRQRNGAVNMHAALCIPAVTGAWRHEGGGALPTTTGRSITGIGRSSKGWTSGIRASGRWTSPGSDPCSPATGATSATAPPVTAMLIQNTNPMMVAPELNLVHQGFAREDLFVCVHEQFLTETAEVADIVLPATMFVEHDDIYQGGGHQYIILGPKIIEPPGECRPNHEVIRGPRAAAWRRASRLRNGGARDHRPDPHALRLARPSSTGARALVRLPAALRGGALPGRVRAPGREVPVRAGLDRDPAARVRAERRRQGDMPRLPDHWPVIEEANDSMPFRLVTAPARHYLNSSFTETPTSIRREGRPTAMIHPGDADRLGLADGRPRDPRQRPRAGAHPRGAVRRPAAGRGDRGESIWPNKAFPDGIWHQRPHRGRSRRPGRRGGVPRQPDLDRGSLNRFRETAARRAGASAQDSDGEPPEQGGSCSVRRTLAHSSRPKHTSIN